MSGDELSKGYNDDELKDIMDEIENLEKEFMQDSSEEPEEVALTVPHSDDSTETVEVVASEKDSNSFDQMIGPEESKEVVHEESTSKQPVSIIDKGKTNMKKSNHPSLHCHGDMTLDLSFDVQGHEAKLSVKDGGCHLHIKGLHLVIDNEKGCIVEMAGGIKFEVPLCHNSEEIKKAS